MKIDELKKQVQEMQNSAQQTSNELHNAECNVDDIESYTSGCRDSIEDCKVSVNNLDDELEDMKVHLDNLEGFDMETVRKEVAEEIIFKLTNKFGKFIKEALASDLSTDELKKAPAKKSTETDNQ
jgi:chromosome segregation ATPase